MSIEDRGIRRQPAEGREGHEALSSGAPNFPGSEGRLVYSISEAAALLGISRALAYELVARGDLPVIRLGRRRLVPKVALLALTGADQPDHGDPGRG